MPPSGLRKFLQNLWNFFNSNPSNVLFIRWHLHWLPLRQRRLNYKRSGPEAEEAEEDTEITVSEEIDEINQAIDYRSHYDDDGGSDYEDDINIFKNVDTFTHSMWISDIIKHYY